MASSCSLPVEVWQTVNLFLPAQDVLSVLCVNRACHSLGESDAFWKRLLWRDNNNDIEASVLKDEPCEVVRRAFLTHAYKNCLPSVRWYALRPDRIRIPDREGHLACVVRSSEQKRKIIITGGFSDDETVYILDPGKPWSPRAEYWPMHSIIPSQPAGFVYGASLTPLEGPYPDSVTYRAIRFGGFRGGGYSHETNQLALLTIRHVEGEQPTARWEQIVPNNPQQPTARAYHTATLLNGRYLLVVGGMMWRESIIDECILDTHTWTWITTPITTGLRTPTGRHGHSIVLDSKRNRLVLFGGGSGTDLLRSGHDDGEVWELQMGGGWEEDLLTSLPWRWSPIRSNTMLDTDGDENLVEASESETARDIENNTFLTPAEQLCLGRCHSSCKISADKVVLFYGSGKPSTNGLIAFDLSSDAFHRPIINGALPAPRFTGVAVGLDEGYILTHGGYSTQESDAIGEWDLLDVAPALGRVFNSLPLDNAREGRAAITDAQAQSNRPTRNQTSMIDLMYRTLLGQAHQIQHHSDEEDDDNEDDSDFDDEEMD